MILCAGFIIRSRSQRSEPVGLTRNSPLMAIYIFSELFASPRRRFSAKLGRYMRQTLLNSTTGYKPFNTAVDTTLSVFFFRSLASGDDIYCYTFHFLTSVYFQHVETFSVKFTLFTWIFVFVDSSSNPCSVYFIVQQRLFFYGVCLCR